MTAVQPPLLSVRDLRVSFATQEGRRGVLDGVSFDVEPGELVGIVGESGSGKSVTALSLMGLLPRTLARVDAGVVKFGGRDLLKLPNEEMRKVRGRSIAMIFQEPMTSLNPVFRIGDQIAEAIRIHERVGERAARARSAELLGRVGIASPHSRLDDFPHQLSGGMRQRVMIAMALACSPKLLLADEPTTALDVTLQARLLDLLRGLQSDFGMAIVLITHNMGVIAEFADRVMVMYGGRIVERAPVFSLFDAPAHPYTSGLLASMPVLDQDETRLRTIRGSAGAFGSGCRFAPRCDRAAEACLAGVPPALALGTQHEAECLYPIRAMADNVG